MKVNSILETKVKFDLGQVVITPNAQSQLNPIDVFTSLARHKNGDWGECDKADWKENDFSLKNGFRLFSVYFSNGHKYWIITEADRSVTTILMPEDY